MARTAPVPNIPPIPGMCPGTIVLAGGAGGSGDGSGDGDGGDGKNKADGSKGENDPNGDGKGGKCGKGGAAGCTGCSAKPAAGDPIDVSSGDVFTQPVIDLGLPGPIPLELRRSYSGGLRDHQVGLGHGWTFTFGWRVEIVGKRVRATTGMGVQLDFVRPEPHQTTFARGCQLSVEGPMLRLVTTDDYIHLFEPTPRNPTLYRLVRVEGPLQLHFRLRYDDKGSLVEVVDTAGRSIFFDPSPNGLIGAIRVPDPTTGASITFVVFRYDDDDNLISATDADGFTTSYAYLQGHRLSRLQYPSGVTFHYNYDHVDRCSESWGVLPTNERGILAPGLPAFLKDGSTPVRGIHHVRIEYGADGSRSVISANQIQRYFVDSNGNVTKAVAHGGVVTRVFDASGNVTGATDRNGATTRYEWDSRNQLIREIDPLGNAVTLRRDANGRVIEMIDPAGGRLLAHRNSHGFTEAIEDQLGAVTGYRWDDRSLMTEMIHPNGSRTTYQSDVHGNLVEAGLPNGAVWRWKYDWWGRTVERTDPAGNVSSLQFSAAGRLLAARERDGSTTYFTRNAAGDPTEVVNPDGTRLLFTFGGMGWPYQTIAANGDTTTCRYDYEGNRIEFTNQIGEVTRWRVDNNGLIDEEESFIGGTERYRRDKMGHLNRVEAGGDIVEFERDALSLPTAINFSDGDTWSYVYDPRSEIVEANNTSCKAEFERNALGYVTKEVVTVDGETTVVQSTFSGDGSRISVTSNLGHTARYERDAIGATTAILLENDQRVTFERDPFGAILKQRLPSGGSLEFDYDPLHRRTRTRAISPALGMPATGQDEPEWLGVKRGGVVVERGYQYSPNSLLTSVTSAGASGQTRYEYDARERLVARIPEREPPEQFTYDPASNIHEVGTKRVYGAGGQLVERSNVRFVRDELGAVVHKIFVDAEGNEQVTRYEWTPQRFLAAVVRPDDCRIEFVYDAIGRRTLKRVLRPDGEGGLRVVTLTRYVWDAWSILHSQKRTLDPSGEIVAREGRTYLFSDYGRWSPIGERQSQKGAGDTAAGKSWFFYATDLLGTPEELLRPDGSIAAQLKRTAFGQTTTHGDVTTDVRFPGQMQDEETGLAYNFHRYYDPELGQYISPDPIGITGGTNLFAYCRNPLVYCDPFGLTELQHGLDMDVYDSSGAKVGSTNDTSGGFVQTNKQGNTNDLPAYDKNDPANNKRTYGPGAPNGTPAMQFPGCDPGGKDTHTEDKALQRLNTPELAPGATAQPGAPGGHQGTMQAGGTAKMRGTYPPCQICHEKMVAYSQNNPQANVEYHYPTKQCIAYKGGGVAATGSGNPAGNNATDLVRGYQDNPSRTGGFWGEGAKDQYRAQRKLGEDGVGQPGALQGTATTSVPTGGLTPM